MVPTRIVKYLLLGLNGVILSFHDARKFQVPILQMARRTAALLQFDIRHT